MSAAVTAGSEGKGQIQLQTQGGLKSCLARDKSRQELRLLKYVTTTNDEPQLTVVDRTSSKQLKKQLRGAVVEKDRQTKDRQNQDKNVVYWAELAAPMGVSLTVLLCKGPVHAAISGVLARWLLGRFSRGRMTGSACSARLHRSKESCRPVIEELLEIADDPMMSPPSRRRARQLHKRALELPGVREDTLAPPAFDEEDAQGGRCLREAIGIDINGVLALKTDGGQRYLAPGSKKAMAKLLRRFDGRVYIVSTSAAKNSIPKSQEGPSLARLKKAAQFLPGGVLHPLIDAGLPYSHIYLSGEKKDKRAHHLKLTHFVDDTAGRLTEGISYARSQGLVSKGHTAGFFMKWPAAKPKKDKTRGLKDLEGVRVVQSWEDVLGALEEEDEGLETETDAGD